MNTACSRDKGANMATSPRAGRILAIVKTVILAVIAIALVKFAFFPAVNNADEGQSLNPGGDYGQMTILPTVSDITNTVSAKGTIEADPATTVKSTGEGVVTFIAAADGTAIETGAPILEVRKEIAPDPVVPTDAEGNATAAPAAPTYQYTTVFATASGTLHLNALLGQQFAIGDAIATIQPPSYSAFATLNADQLYRIQNAPEQATITITNGPAPFTCTGLRIETPKASANAQASPAAPSSSGDAANSGGIRAVCPIPAEQKVFPGLQVTMDVVAGSATGVLTLPISAVEGRFESGFVYVPNPDGGKPTKKPVKLGLTDGKIVEVKEGLTESDEVLEFIPNSASEEKGSESMDMGGAVAVMEGAA